MSRFSKLLRWLAFALTYVPALVLGQALSNGGVNAGQIIVAGQQETYSFAANAGEGVQLRIGKTSGTLFPRFDVVGPTGAAVGSSSCGVGGVGDFFVNTPVTGLYTVVVYDCSTSTNGTGSYNLYFTRAPGANEGGTLINGGQAIPGVIDLGDLDSATFTANAGEGVQLRVGKTGGTLFPRLAVYGPTGAVVGTSSCGVGVVGAVGDFFVSAPVTGTYTVVVYDCNTSANGAGGYNLYFTRAPGANEGGTLINGGQAIPGVIDLGDLDSATFNASAGEGVQLRVGKTSGTLFPRLTVYDPTGTVISSSSCGVSGVGQIFVSTPVTGLYTVVVYDCNTSANGTGSYNLYFTRAPGANEGGTLINGGQAIPGFIDLGDLDSATFTANAGEGLQLRVGKTGGTLFPRLAVYGPTGAVVGTSSCGVGVVGAVGDFFVSAPVTGTYTVVVYDCNTSANGTGSYNLYFTRAPGANEGGSLNDAVAHPDRIDLGDLDSYTFTVRAGDAIQVTATRQVTTLLPRFFVYGPTGAFVGASNCAASATMSFAAVTPGTYTLVAFDCSVSAIGTGGYSMTLTGATGVPPADGDVPIPLWALAMLSALLGRTALRSRRWQSR